MSDTWPPPVPLRSLLRKAAVDAGFDLEPEADGGWWRLRSSGVPGVVWIVSARTGSGAAVALPTVALLDELDLAVISDANGDTIGAGGLPLGAAGAVFCQSAEELHGALRRVSALRASLSGLLGVRLQSAVTATVIVEEQATGVPFSTEALALVRRRVGQDLFRDALLDYWEGRCAVSGLSVRELLRASHAKPWAAATDAERLDVHNGLLLAVHIDALFDQGFLTFDDMGCAIGSPKLSAVEWASLGVAPGSLRLRNIHPAHLPYLAYHRAHVYRGVGVTPQG